MQQAWELAKVHQECGELESSPPGPAPLPLQLAHARRTESWGLLTSSSLPGKQLLNSLFAQSGTGERVAGSSWASFCFDSPREKCIFKNFPLST